MFFRLSPVSFSQTLVVPGVETASLSAASLTKAPIDFSTVLPSTAIVF